MAGRYTDQHPQFSDSNGVPLAGGQIEFFIVGTTGVGNRKNTFSDVTLATPNPNPISLDGNGRSINPIFLDGTYNTIIRDSDLVQIDQVDNVVGVSGAEGSGSQVVNIVADLKPINTTSFKEVYVLGTTVIGDGGQGHFYFNSISVESDNGVDVIEPTVGGGRWLLQNNAHNSITTAQAAGSSDAIIIATSPLSTALDSERVFFVENTLGPNTITGVTFKVDATLVKPLKRDNSTVLVVGDTGPVGYKMRVQLLDDDSAYILSNPFELADNVVTTNKINNLAVTTAKIDSLAVTEGKIGALAVVTAKIDNLAVTEGKINSLAVTEGKIGALAVTVGKIGALAVTSAKIALNAVTNTILANMAQSTIKGRASGAGTGDPTDLTPAQVYTIIEDEVILGIQYRSDLSLTNSADADHDVTISSGSIMDNANAELISLTSATTKKIDAVWVAGSGNGGRASSLSLSNNTWYRVFLIKNSGGTVDAGFDTSSTAANLLSDSGYTFFRRIGWVLTDGSANILQWVYSGRNSYTWVVGDFDLSSSATSATAQTVGVKAPPGQQALILVALNKSATGLTNLNITQLDEPDALGAAHITVAGDGTFASYNSMPFYIIVSSTSLIRYRSNNANGFQTITTKGWVDDIEVS